MQIIAESSELTREVKAYRCDAMRFIFFLSILRFLKKLNTSIVWVKPQSFIDLSVSWLHSIWNSFEYRAAFAGQKVRRRVGVKLFHLLWYSTKRLKETDFSKWFIRFTSSGTRFFQMANFLIIVSNECSFRITILRYRLT